MNLLVFETATPSGGVALVRDGELAGVAQINSAQAHSRLSVDLARLLVEAQGMTWGQLDVFAASHGPGAFTGIRVGLTLAKGMAWSLGRPMVTMSSLAVLAAGAVDAGVVATVVDARMGEIYGAVYTVEDGLPRLLGEEFAATPAEAAPRFATLAAGAPLVFCGEGAIRYHAEHFAPLGPLARMDRRRSTPAAAALLALTMAQAGHTISPEAAAAVYLREATTTPPPPGR
jgi:tRNA threonylcarbamoyladenosine biosynthesis protein TsaB